MKKKWIDISQPLTNHIAHWPGDTSFSYELSITKEQTGSVNIGKITTSLHTGTHVDAAFHFDNEGPGIEQSDINDFIGITLVVDATGTSTLSSQLLQETELASVSKVLFKTKTESEPNHFPEHIPVIDPQLAPFLREHGITLVGVDVPSVDDLNSKELQAHHNLFQQGIHILENVALDDITPGLYELIALPLAIQGADGSPVRAVVRPL
ncbi:arylformamidase [Radiobacillus kanasensis]|uniref:arylformamidase n=1 Tax=Radiobacillus kanasensis TaxID=2844358 RepID=UPI001E500B1F|nr:arylformamidase [Radiobacillus kanasensis]UFU00716.1 arylformamidase [Radiobacillus kanasensis]